MQNSRERVKAAIQCQQLDRIPKGELCLDDTLIKQVLKCDHVGFEERVSFINSLGLDLVCLSPDYPTCAGIPTASGITLPDLERWVLDTPLFTFALIDGSFGWGMRTLGYADFLTLPRRSPLALQELIENVERLNKDLIKRCIDQGVDGIILADDIAYQRGLLLNPNLLRNKFFPSLSRQVVAVKDQVPVFFHSDGDYAEVIPDLIKCGFRGLQCFERRAGMDPLKLKCQYPELCVWGTLEVEDLERAADPGYLEKVISEIAELSSRGGFILGTTCGLFPGINLDGLTAIYERF